MHLPLEPRPGCKTRTASNEDALRTLKGTADIAVHAEKQHAIEMSLERLTNRAEDFPPLRGSGLLELDERTRECTDLLIVLHLASHLRAFQMHPGFACLPAKRALDRKEQMKITCTVDRIQSAN